MEGLLANIISTLFGWILNLFGATTAKSDYQIRYEDLRYKTAKALTMYANCLSNPINIEECSMPDGYKQGQMELRRIASEFDALAKVIPSKARGIPVSKSQLLEVSKYLIGLSNSFLYAPIELRGRGKNVREWEQTVRKILNIQD